MRRFPVSGVVHQSAGDSPGLGAIPATLEPFNPLISSGRAPGRSTDPSTVTRSGAAHPAGPQLRSGSLDRLVVRGVMSAGGHSASQGSSDPGLGSRQSLLEFLQRVDGASLERHQPVRRIRVTWWDDSVRLAPLVAAAAAVADLLLLGLLHVVSPGVDPMTRPVSEYALGDFGWLATTRTVVQGVGLIALALALILERAATRRLEWAAALILLVVGLLKLATPLFPVDALGTPATTAGQIHNVLGNLTFFLLPLAALLLFRTLTRMGSRSAPACSVVLAVATVGVLIGNAVGGFGLAQRAYLVLSAIWLFLAARAVLSNRRSQDASS